MDKKLNVFVGSSSRNVINKEYDEFAAKVAEIIVDGKYNFVFGACNSGTMGIIYNAVAKCKECEILGVKGKQYEHELVDLPELTHTFIYPTVNDIKNKFIELADIIIYLPGGLGTFDEICSLIEARRRGEHNVPIVLVNINDYYSPMLQQFERCYEQGFADASDKKFYKVVTSIDQVKECVNSLL